LIIIITLTYDHAIKPLLISSAIALSAFALNNSRYEMLREGKKSVMSKEKEDIELKVRAQFELIILFK